MRFLAWLETKLNEGYDITEYEAAQRLTEFRRKNKHFMGLAYENISASGPNAALPHYSPRRSTARMIDRDAPYLKYAFLRHYRYHSSTDATPSLCLVTRVGSTATARATRRGRCILAAPRRSSATRLRASCRATCVSFLTYLFISCCSDLASLLFVMADRDRQRCVP